MIMIEVVLAIINTFSLERMQLAMGITHSV